MKLPQSSEAHLELKRVGDIAGKFRVARYQRGYRWGEIEVNRLLNDIWENGDKSYSLQPVVVKREGESEWELVDGQQRLTTLYLIFAFMQRAALKNVAPQYSISYDTRPKSQEYLLELDPAQADSNIDFYHLRKAYESISTWFEKNGPTPGKRQVVADEIFGYLYKRVYVIWYEAPVGGDSMTTLFRRLNVGRIHLTDAELFKALLLSSSPGGDGATDRTHEFAAQWDSIERDLHDPDVWAFVADKHEREQPTRITLLLDAIAGDPVGRTRPRFYTFDVLHERMEKYSPKEVWNEVVHLHALVLGWFENRDHYHKIGYLVAVGQQFRDLVELAVGRTKRDFEAALDARIRDTLNLTPSGVMDLSYEKEPHHEKFAHLLLLMNVETVRRLKNSTERYSFRLHRGEDWSLEHIHAQHAESLPKAEQWKEWLRLHREVLADMPNIDAALRENLLKRIDAVGAKIERPVFQDISRDVTAAFTLEDSSASVHSVHSISNLALLSSGANSALNNAVFEVKRRRILDLDRQGAYIPVCTRHVFLKYYTDADAQQIHFWSPQDREAYLKAIFSPDSGVGRYLQPEAPVS